MPKGFKHSEEAKKKMSEARKKRITKEETRKRKSIAVIGDNNPNWKGGIIIKINGYVMIKKPEHPNSDNQGYVLEHRLIMEEILGRYLTPEETVHHINKQGMDNRPENLMLFSNRGQHTHYHALLRKKPLPFEKKKKDADGLFATDMNTG